MAPVMETGGWHLTDAFAKNPPPVPKGKNENDYIYFDDKLTRFGLRRRDGKLSWIVQYRVRGKTKRRTLGNAQGRDALTVKDARKAADLKLSEIKLGADPHSSRGGERLGQKVETYLAGLNKGTIGIGRDRSRKIRPRTLLEIEGHFKLHWSELNGWPLHEITRKVIAEHLRTITENAGPVAANRARSSLSGFFRWAIGEGIAAINPVAGTHVAPENDPRKRTLDDAEIADVWNACHDDHYGSIVRLLILTGQRKGEVAGMADSELEPAERLWLIPGARTKNRREHAVPLSDAALEVIASQTRIAGRDLLFGYGNGGFSGWSRCKKRLDARIAAARKKAGRKPMAPWILHDLRRTMRTGLSKLEIAPHVAEACINHLPSTLVQTYDRHPYAKEKREALESWAAYVKNLVPDEPSNIVKIAGKR